MGQQPDPVERPVPFGDLVAVSAAVAAQPARGSKVTLVADFLGDVPPGQVPHAVAALTGTLPAPLGVGPARLRAAWLQSTEQPSLAIGGTSLTLPDVDRGLREVARLPSPNPAAREAAAAHDVRVQAARIAEILRDA